MALLNTVYVLLFAAGSVAAGMNPGPASDSCPGSVYNLTGDAPKFNSTGTAQVTFNDTNGQDPGTWYVSTTIKETVKTGNSSSKRNSSSPISSSFEDKALLLEQFLSVPESWVGSEGAKDTQLCIYMAFGLNKTTDKAGSCDGVLDDKCMKVFTSAPAPENGVCGLALSTTKDCGVATFLNNRKLFKDRTLLKLIPTLKPRLTKQKQTTHSTFPAPTAQRTTSRALMSQRVTGRTESFLAYICTPRAPSSHGMTSTTCGCARYSRR